MTHVRRPVARGVHRPPRADEHAAAGAAAAERAAVRRGGPRAWPSGRCAEGGATPTDRIALPVPAGAGPAAGRRRSWPSCSTALRGRPARRTTSDPAAAKKLIAVGETKPDAALDPAELAAWTMVANLVLNLDEVMNEGLTRRRGRQRPADASPPMNPIHEHLQAMTRRHFFGRRGARPRRAPRWRRSLRRAGAGAAASATGGLPGLPHFAPKAKRAIYLFMNGGPSQMDLFDYKPKMADLFDKDLPDVDPQGPAADDDDQRPGAASRSRRRSTSSPSTARRGAWVSELLPCTAKIVDDLCRRQDRSTPRRSTTTRPSPTSAPATSCPAGRASASWLSYGLGTMNAEPAGVRRHDAVVDRPEATPRRSTTGSGARGFLPSKHQGVALRSQGDPVLFLSNPPGVDAATRRRMLDALARLNQQHARRGRRPGDAGAHRPVRDGLPHADVACRS